MDPRNAFGGVAPCRRVSAEEMKRLAAEASLRFVRPGMVVGLGTGSTARLVLEGLAVADGGLGAWDEGRGLGAFVAGLSDEESNALVEALGDPGGGVEL